MFAVTNDRRYMHWTAEGLLIFSPFLARVPFGNKWEKEGIAPLKYNSAIIVHLFNGIGLGFFQKRFSGRRETVRSDNTVAVQRKINKGNGKEIEGSWGQVWMREEGLVMNLSRWMSGPSSPVAAVVARPTSLDG